MSSVHKYNQITIKKLADSKFSDAQAGPGFLSWPGWPNPARPVTTLGAVEQTIPHRERRMRKSIVQKNVAISVFIKVV